MRPTAMILALLLLHGCAAFGVHSASDEAEATLLATHTFHDYEIARAASSSALARLEGSFQLEPHDEDLMILLADAWVTHAELFLVDAYERAQAADSGADVEYERQRVRAGFERARHWGLSWFRARAPELETNTLDDATLTAALEDNFDDAEDATALVVLGHAFLGAATYSGAASDGKDSGEQLAKLAALLLERAIELDEGTRLGNAHGLLGMYYANVAADTTKATGHFQRATLLSNGSYLLTQVRAALALHCREGDRDAFESALNSVLEAGDPVPQVRLDNAVAKRRASRWLTEPSLRASCRF